MPWQVSGLSNSFGGDITGIFFDLKAMPSMPIRPMTPADAEAVLAIYQQGIDTGEATFQAQAPDWEEWDAGHHPHSRLVFLNSEGIAGWAALAPVSSRPVYAGVADISIYVATEAAGQGIGGQLMDAVIEAAEANGIWTIQAGIFPENTASIALHKKHGFRVVGTRERLGLMSHGPKSGAWRDVVFMERRSTLIGSD